MRQFIYDTTVRWYELDRSKNGKETGDQIIKRKFTVL